MIWIKIYANTARRLYKYLRALPDKGTKIEIDFDESTVISSDGIFKRI